MEIRCPICGKKYSYDRKICQECEDYSIYSNLCDIHDDHKWNCSVFLTINSSAFKTSRIRDLTKELSPEPNNLAIQERKLHSWNCSSRYQDYRPIEMSFKPLTLGDFSAIIRNKTDSHLLFE
ncbi:MAG: hypothetical protein ACFFBE_18025 [Promethearchaeota archaeon]